MAKLLDDLAAAFKCYLALPEGAAETMTLWAMFSHCLDCSATRLAVVSPTKQCGRTTGLEMLTELVSRRLPAAKHNSRRRFSSNRSCAPRWSSTKPIHFRRTTNGGFGRGFRLHRNHEGPVGAHGGVRLVPAHLIDRPPVAGGVPPGSRACASSIMQAQFRNSGTIYA